ncbi:MAG: ATP-binding protein [Kofleriaceae bacterium]|nr:ATP-binding protein [Kofleriaceae bacterium]
MIALPPSLTDAIRRVRLEAALAYSEQREGPEAERRHIRELLVEARRRELAHNMPDAPLQNLVRRLGLTSKDQDFLLATLALEVDPLFATTVAGLAGEEPRHGISPRVAAQIFRAEGDEAMTLVLSAGHPLTRSAILETQAAPTTPDTLKTWRMAPRVVQYLAGSDAIDPQLRRIGRIVPVPEGIDVTHVKATTEMLDRAFAQGDNVVLCIEGLDGIGRRTLVAHVAALHGKQVIAIDLGRLSAERARFAAAMRALQRECWLRGAVPLVARVDAVPEARRVEVYQEIGELLEGTDGPAFVTCQAGTALPELERRLVRLRLDPPSARQRLALWVRALAGHPTRTGFELAEAVQFFVLTPQSIERAAANVRMLAAGRELDVTDVRAGVQAETQERFSGLAARVAVTQKWDDLILPQDTLDDVRAFSARASHAAEVYEKWGFRDKLQRGLGLSALFSGPPGTGKTMVAGLIAQSLGLDLYVVDLSQVVSKWVGETEKQLGKIFDAGAMGNVVLLFDEADALFAKRTEVKSSNDRYANLEVNYLLQRLEAYSGIAILTTNLEGSVDPAFMRRLASHVRFYAPELAERERLWRTLVPASAPLADNIDYEGLAERWEEFAGGHIRNAVLRAAFLAAAENTSISNEHLERAARSESRAMGNIVGEH